MDTLHITKQHPLATYLVASAGLLLVGAIVGAFVDPYLPSRLSNTEKGFVAARTLVEDSSIGNFFRTQLNRSTISGTVTAIQGNRISIHDSSLKNDSLNILFDIPFIIDRTIIVDATTEVVKLTENTSLKSQVGGNGAREVQQIKPDGSVSTTSPTTTYLETPANVSGIKTGDILIIIAPEGAKTETEITAQKILIAPPAK